MAILKLPDWKRFGNLNYRGLGNSQGEGWYFVGQNLRSHSRSPSSRSTDVCLGSSPSIQTFFGYSPIGRGTVFKIQKNAQDFEYYNS